jgi:predicted nucleic acid-binding protein
VKREVLGGASPKEREKLIACFSVLPYCSIKEERWDSDIELKWKMRSLGFSIPWNDLLVAACALSSGERIYARDKHFNQMAAHLPFRLYEPGYGGSYRPE